MQKPQSYKELQSKIKEQHQDHRLRKHFSYFWSTSHPDASYQVSSKLAQGCWRSTLLKWIVHAEWGMMQEAWWTLTDHNSSLWALHAQVS